MKCRTKRKPPAKFPMKLKSKPWVVFFSLPMNIKGRAALLSLAVHSEGSREGQGSFAADEMEMEKPHFVPGSCRAGDETGWHKCCWRCQCDTQQFHTPSQPFQPLPVCKYHLRGGKTRFAEFCWCNEGANGSTNLSLPPRVGMAQTWSPNPGSGRFRALGPSPCWLQLH